MEHEDRRVGLIIHSASGQSLSVPGFRTVGSLYFCDILLKSFFDVTSSLTP